MPSTLFVHDEEFYAHIKHIQLKEIEPQEDYFNYLLRAIAFQQLSGSAGATIHGRFIENFPNENPSPQEVLDMPFDLFREAGLSGQKSTYMQNIARYWIEHKITKSMLDGMADRDLISFLMQIKGVGRWTAEMLLIFGLGRRNVFPLDDLTIQQGFASMFSLHALPVKELKRQMLLRSDKWSPNRSWAARLIWAWMAEQRLG